MFQKIFTSDGVWRNGMDLIRIVVGVLLIIHGFQIFQSADMKGYEQWLSDLHFPFPQIMPYVGKMVELLGGICLVFGMFLRIATALLFINFILITIVMGEGKILTDSQHPFLFALLALVYFFQGSGTISLDHYFSRRRNFE